MKIALRFLLVSVGTIWLSLAGPDGRAQQTDPPPQVETAEPAAEAIEREAEPAAASEETTSRERRERDSDRRYRHGDDFILHFGQDSYLAADNTADAVIAIFGSATAAGAVDESVVSIFGDTHVTGPVGSAAVAIFGDTYVNSSVGETAVAVFGNLHLGPSARIDGDVVAVGGTIIRDPQAIVRGGSREILVGDQTGRFEGLRAWIKHCLLYARPLAFEPGLGWAWAIALGFLLFYIVVAAMFGGSVEKCVATLETQPGQSVVASFLTVLLAPALILLLAISVIGIAIVPFVGLALLAAAAFGKVVVLATLGRRMTRFIGIGPFNHVAFAALVGGLIVLALYVVPVLGFVAYKVLGILGLGVVAYTVLLAMRQRRAGETIIGSRPAPATTASMPSGAGTVPPPSDAARAAPPQPTDMVALPRAGFWIRMAALLIDIILVGVIVSILDPPGEMLLLALASYGAIMWKLKSTTIGGIVCGLKVVRRDGGEVSWDTAIVRALSCFLSFGVVGLGFLWIVFDEDRQAWHDKIAGTLVVHPPKTEPLV